MVASPFPPPRGRAGPARGETPAARDDVAAGPTRRLRSETGGSTVGSPPPPLMSPPRAGPGGGGEPRRRRMRAPAPRPAREGHAAAADGGRRALRQANLSAVEEETGTCRLHRARPDRDGAVADPTARKGVEKGRLITSIAKHRIKTGGSRNLHQIASTLGHTRQRGLVSTNTGNIDNHPATNQSLEKNPLIIEMGAGRGMTGRCHTCLRKKC